MQQGMQQGMQKGMRHYGMDWLRIAAFAILILYHIGMYFVPWGWHVKTPEPVEWARIPMLASNAWRLALLFAVSGFASAALFAKLESTGGFLRSRTSRLLVPLAFGMILVVPVQPWIELTTQHGYTGSFWHFFAHDYFRFGALEGIVLPTWNHLWFVAYLWVYTLIVCAAAWLLPRSWRAAIGAAAGRALGGPLLLLVPLALLALRQFVLFPGGAETHALVDDLYAHSAYFPIFLFGWLLFGNAALWAAVRRWWIVAGVAALIAYAGVLLFVAAMLAGRTIDPAFGPLVDGLRIVQGWGAIVGLIGLADRFANRDHPWRKTLTEAVFPFYIVHQSIIVGVGYWLLGTGIGNGAAFAVLLAATAAGCAGFYWGGRMIGPIRPFIGLARPSSPNAAAPIAAARQSLA